MAKPRNKYADYLAYIALRIFAMIMHMFPWRANYVTAKIIGNLIYKFDARHRNRAIEHLRRSFPGWTERKYASIARASLRNLVYLGVEFLFTTRLIAVGSWRQHVRLKNMGPTMQQILENKSGLIMLTGHFGNWEVVGYTMAALGFPSVSVARRIDNPYIDRYVIGVRERAGQRILDKNGAASVVPDVLEQRGTVGFIADQDAGRKGAFVDFFGRKASTYKIIALMAMQYNVPVIVGYGKRLRESYSFEIGIQRVISPSEWAGKEDPLMWITQEFTTALEQIIREAPEQYLWVHRRWKHRPKGEESSPDGIA